MTTLTTRGTLSKGNFDDADETRPIPKGKIDVLNLDDALVMRATFEPGWRWSESVQPIANTASCEVAHEIYVVSGRMGMRMDDGTEMEIGPGDFCVVPPGHDAWVIGNEAFVAIDFHGGAHYAKDHHH